jgi:SAM-dependent methyltransferase
MLSVYIAYIVVLFSGLLLSQYLFGFYQDKPQGIATLGRGITRHLEFDSTTLGGAPTSNLLLVSFLSMFLELLMIRWISSEIRIFAFFKNFVLVSCFFGFGMGCYFSRKRINVLTLIGPLVYLAAVIKIPWSGLRTLIATLPNMLGSSSNLQIWHAPSLDAQWVLMIQALAVTAPLFVMMAFTFVPIGQMIGHYLESSPAGLRAYSLNVAASLLGILAFTGASFLNTPPALWFSVVGACLVALFWRKPLFTFTAVAGVLICVGLSAITPGDGSTTYWSPYQKLTIAPVWGDGELISYELNTNDSWYQRIVNLTPQFVKSHPKYFESIPIAWNPYNIPYRFYPSPASILVLGAGMGNDVAAAVRNTNASVVAVEIDPTILRLGRALHFEKPYDSGRVRIVEDDARSFMHNSHERFDLILFSLLDSHTTNSNYTNIRIDNYVYTVEALEEARQLLTPEGLLIVKFQAENDWIAGRLDALLTRVFGIRPVQISSDSGYTTSGRFFISGSQVRIKEALGNPEVAAYISEHHRFSLADAPITDDNWPYFYQRRPGIPTNIVLMSLFVVLLSFWFAKRTDSRVILEWHFFFLGAGFLLLEVQIISKIALLFGTTWLVNSFVISALLLFIVAANWTVQKFPRVGIWTAYAGIFLFGLLAYFLSIERYFFENVVVRALCALVILCSPAYFAGIVFAKSYAACGFRSSALGSNVLGALCGGIVESLSFWTGIRSLVLVALGFYVLSALLAQKGEVRLATTVTNVFTPGVQGGSAPTAGDL